MAKRMQLKDVDLSARYKGGDFEAELRVLQKELMAVQLARFRAGLRTVIVFEGWDAAGKGGTIKRFVHYLDPRMCRVWPIAAPSGTEKAHHYLHRFWTRLPEAGSIAIFDRSWYGRVLVERVEGHASPAEWQRGYREINEFERLLVDDGVLVLKYFLHLSAHEQGRRFLKRMDDPVKRWKLTGEDFLNRSRRPDYELAIQDMLDKTSTDRAPWRIIAAESKKSARLAVLRDSIGRMEEGVDMGPFPLDPDIRELADRLREELAGEEAD